MGTFLLLAVLVGITSFRAARDAVASWDMTHLVGVPVHLNSSVQPGQSSSSEVDPAGSGQESNAPSQDNMPPYLNLPESAPLAIPNPWNGKDRVTILVMGEDYRDWQKNEGPPRSDTMILLTIDPKSMTAGMLFIPRDLWVDIPGMEKPNKINTALRFGELYKLPGGGPGLAMKTVEKLLGVKVDYYAQIDFSSFERFVDEIGGIDVNVPADIKVDPLGPHNTVDLQAGVQHLDGPTALAYARNRSTLNDDYDRSERQKQVILAIRDKILSLNMLPTLASHSPALYQELSTGLHTDLSLNQVTQLAWLAQQVPHDSIHTAIIGPNEVVYAKSEDGLDIDQPKMDRILKLVDEVFGSGSPH